jgi:integrase
MAKVRIRHLVYKTRKDGVHYYWEPSRGLRNAGFTTVRLSNVLDLAVSEAEHLNRRADAWRNGTERLPAKPETLPWLIRLYQSDERFKRLELTTRQGYEQALKKIEAWSSRAGDPPLKSLMRKHVKQFYRSMSGKPGAANSTMRVLRILLQFAVDEGYLQQNTASRPGLHARPPRQSVWTEDQILAFVKAAHACGRASMALAVLLGVYIGQRQGDILRLNWSQYDGSLVTLKQNKTGILLSVPVTSELKAALDETPRRSPIILVAEATQRPYQRYYFNHEFRRIANLAQLGDLQFLDLRRSAVVRLAEAGCTVPEIAAITGHQLDRTARILETYLPRTAPMARAAIRKLELHRRRTESDAESESLPASRTGPC